MIVTIMKSIEISVITISNRIITKSILLLIAIVIFIGLLPHIYFYNKDTNDDSSVARMTIVIMICSINFAGATSKVMPEKASRKAWKSMW